MLRTMKTRVARGRYGKDEGFTLIELMVVVLIIAILLAIAIPTFLGAQNKAKDRSAQSSLRNTVTVAKTANADKQDYAAVTLADLIAAEPSLSFVAKATTSGDPKVVSVDFNATNTFIAAAWSKAGTCFFIRDDSANGTTPYGKDATLTATTCKASAAGTATWGASW